ncbi:MAG: tRNA (adenosine(37)-N6)-dimethylallyltransferase MiaA [Puniceicoccales bacterium]|jgi:tRNA dimethylallyltransferase|nr:tRNA (adenosine(37)-N6)-dimethylallyltransferase MiaA [Puniceicoccales bacterium]
METFPLITIAGATGTGKSALAMKLAENFGGEILSCDSTQVYRGMDIGTAKATTHEQRRIKHYGLDLIEPHEMFDVVQFTDYARQVLFLREKPLIAVGGSGFYLKALYGCVCDAIAISTFTRCSVEYIWETAGLAGLLAELDRRHGYLVEEVDRKNPRRVRRALERCMESGQCLHEVREQFMQQKGPFASVKKITILLEDSTDDYDFRLQARIQKMLEDGLIVETERLRRQNFECNPSACRAVGYREVLAFLDGKISRDTLAENIFRRTKQLVRKQRTWFRHQLPIDITLPHSQVHDVGAVVERIKNFTDIHKSIGMA